jgi:hypothetical protein
LPITWLAERCFAAVASVGGVLDRGRLHADQRQDADGRSGSISASISITPAYAICVPAFSFAAHVASQQDQVGDVGDRRVAHAHPKSSLPGSIARPRLRSCTRRLW